MQDTEIKLAKCGRCQAYTWAAHVSGVRVAVDPLPLTSYTGVLAALSTSRSVYEVRMLAGGKPDRLRYLGGPNWSPQGRTLVAAHACGADASASVPVELPPQDPRQAPATPGRHEGGFPHAPAPADGSQGHTAVPSTPGYSATSQSHARRASPRLSKKDLAEKLTDARQAGYHRSWAQRLECSECGRLLTPGDDYVAIQHGTYKWAQHSYDCVVEPEGDTKYGLAFTDKCNQVGWDAALDLARKDLSRKPMETVELPE